MDIRDAWNRMDSNTQRLVVELYSRYNRNGSGSDLREIRDIFKNHECDDADEAKLARVLKR